MPERQSEVDLIGSGKIELSFARTTLDPSSATKAPNSSRH